MWHIFGTPRYLKRTCFLQKFVWGGKKVIVQKRFCKTNKLLGTKKSNVNIRKAEKMSHVWTCLTNSTCFEMLCLWRIKYLILNSNVVYLMKSWRICQTLHQTFFLYLPFGLEENRKLHPKFLVLIWLQLQPIHKKWIYL